MQITEITLNPQKVIPGDPLRMRAGEAIVEGGHVVDKINYCPENRLFNKGLEIGVACYAVYFNGIVERRLISEKLVTSVEVKKELPAPNAEENIPLPD